MSDAGRRNGGASVDVTSTEWVEDLLSEGPRQEASIDRLFALLLRIARVEASRRSGMNGISGQELDDLAHQAASDAVVSVLRKVGEFRGDSRFTTWAYKFVVFEVSNKLGRHMWRREGIQLDEESWSRLPARLGSDPEDVAQSRELVAAVRRAVEEELSPRQRYVFVALVVEGTPLDTLVAELASNRNAVYKMMFDARRKLHAHLVAQGLIGDGNGQGVRA